MYFEYWVSPTADIMKDGVGGGQEDWGKPNERLGHCTHSVCQKYILEHWTYWLVVVVVTSQPYTAVWWLSKCLVLTKPSNISAFLCPGTDPSSTTLRRPFAMTSPGDGPIMYLPIGPVRNINRKQCAWAYLILYWMRNISLQIQRGIVSNCQC